MKAKKSFIIVLICLLSFGNVSGVVASGNNMILDTTEGLNTEIYAPENARIYNKGLTLLKTRTSTILALANFPSLKQSNSQWGNEIMLTRGVTISSQGCCLTSFTMVQQYYGGTQNPSGVNTTMGNYACPFYWYQAETLYNYTLGVFVDSTTSYNNTLAYVVGAINESKPVIIGLINESGGTHFVVAYGYAYSNILIRDPGGDNGYLSDYTNAGYSVYRIAVYSNS